MKLNELKKEKKFKVSPLYALERKNNLKALIIFSIIAAILVFITVAMFNLMEDALKMLEGMFENSPELKEQIAELIGSQNIATYFVLQAGQVWGLLGIIYAAFLGCKLNATSGRLRGEIGQRRQIRRLLRLVRRDDDAGDGPSPSVGHFADARHRARDARVHVCRDGAARSSDALPLFDGISRRDDRLRGRADMAGQGDMYFARHGKRLNGQMRRAGFMPREPHAAEKGRSFAFHLIPPLSLSCGRMRAGSNFNV